VADELGDEVADADAELRRTPRGPALEGVHELAAEPEDLVGVAEDEAARLRQLEAPADALEELLPQLGLEGPYLAADRRLGQTELLGGRRHRPLLGHHPEVEEVMVVQPLHRVTLYDPEAKVVGGGPAAPVGPAGGTTIPTAGAVPRDRCLASP
jgi:hypothetical protein